MIEQGSDISKSALIIVDMQNDFVHPDGEFGILSKTHPERNIDFEFLSSPIANVKRLAQAFREAGRPVVYIAHVVKEDYSDAAFPYWRRPRRGNSEFIMEGTWGAQVIDELTPEAGENVVIKKGFGGFGHTPLDTILRNYQVSTCVVTGVTSCVCVSTTIRGGVENNYSMIVVEDGTAEIQKDMHDHEMKTMARIFAEVKSSDEVIAMLDGMD